MSEAEVLALTKSLVRYPSFTPDATESLMGFIGDWFETRALRVDRYRGAGSTGQLTSLATRVGSGRPHILLHAHADVVPGGGRQFEPRKENGRLYGRGVYDMKGALAAMMYAVEDLHVIGCEGTVELLVVPNEEREYGGSSGTDVLVEAGHVGDFSITGEPTDFHIGVQAKGVLFLRIEVLGESAHGSSPWLGKNALLMAYEHYHRVLELPFARQSGEIFAFPSINMSRLNGGDAMNKVPDFASYDLDIRYLPEQDPGEILEQIRSIGMAVNVETLFVQEPTYVSCRDPFVGALQEVAARHYPAGSVSIARNGGSDIVHFQRVGVPAVEFGPVGGGHHGPKEYVLIASLEIYRQMLVQLVQITSSNVRNSADALLSS